ncbi:hypothetical protein AB7280_18420, partial [Providencia rettgeri]
MTKLSGHSLNVNTIYYDDLYIEYTTQKMIKDIFKTNDSIYIEIKNDKWLNKISIPKLPLSNKKIKVKSTADRNSSIVGGYYTYIIKSGDLLTISAKQDWSIDKKN